MALQNRKDANILKAIRLEYPDYIPMRFHINPACWSHYDRNALQDLMAEHPLLFPEFEKDPNFTPAYLPNQLKNAPYTDPWGCVWETYEDGITGAVQRHPLEDWSSFTDYCPPDPSMTDGTYQVDWDAIRAQVEKTKEQGNLVMGSLPHGHTFLRLQDIRGYENLLLDMMQEEPRLLALIEMVEAFNQEYVKRWLELEPDIMKYPEDLGMQSGPMLYPGMFCKYIKPVYKKLMQPARDQGCIVHMHSDGDIRTLVDDLVEDGVQVINLQDLVNGIDWIAAKFAGRICIDLDIDRQHVTPKGTPRDIDALIEEETRKLGSKKGGLMMLYGLYPGVPMENVKVLMDAMERYATRYSG